MRTTAHPFGDLLTKLRVRQPGLTQARLAELAGYDPAVIARMGQGQKDLTGPQARERVIRIIETLDAAGVVNGVAEADALLAAATLPPLFAGNYVEAELIQQLALHRRTETDDAAALNSPARHNLPAQLTSFIGREQEIEEISQFLTGPAHTGSRLSNRSNARPSARSQARLALEVALTLLAEFADGVWWVSLGALNDPALIAQTIADTLRLNHSTQAAPLRMLADYLANRRLLLVLDNCEHLVDACAELVAHLMGYCPTLRLLATSREALQVPGELALRVPPLTVPRPSMAEQDFLADKNSVMDFDAVRLFVERAQAIRPDFDLTAANARAVAHICERLDGIPLALELAAALLQILSVDEIAARIDNRFTLLKGGYRTATPRHQALSNAMDWSYELLTPVEQILLARLSVFVGGWDTEAAEGVCANADGSLKRAEVLPTLRQLVNKSLIVIDEKGTNLTHYRLLKTIHEYAAEKLRERNEYTLMKDSHLTYLVNFAEAKDALLTTREHASAGEQLTAQRDELRAALAYAEESGNVEMLLRLTAALQSFWRGGYRVEGTQWMNRALASASAASARLRLAVLFAWAWTFPDEAAHLAKHAPMIETCLEKCRAAQDQIGTAQALTVLSDIVRAVHSDFAQARTYLQEAWPIFEASGDRRAISTVRHKMGVVLKQLDRAAAETWMQESANLYSASRDSLYLSTTLADLAWLIEDQNPKDARLVGLWRKAVEAAHASGSGGLEAEFSLNLGNIELSLGDRAQAAEHFGQALELCCAADGDTEDKGGIYWTILSLCKVDSPRALTIIERYLQGKQQLADKHGVPAGTYFLGVILQEGTAHDHEQSREHFEQSLRLWRELGVIITRYGYGGVTRNLLALGQANHFLGQDQRAVDCFDECIRLCAEFKHDEFLTMLHMSRGCAKLQLSELDQAEADFHSTWKHALAWMNADKAMAIAGLGEVAQRRGQAALSAKLLGWAANQAHEIHSGTYSWRANYEALIAAARERLSDPTYAAAWAAGQKLSLDEAKLLVSTPK